MGVAGYGNWKIHYRRLEHGISICRAVTCDALAELPESIQGEPVIRIEEYALSAKEKKLPADEDIEYLEIVSPRKEYRGRVEWGDAEEETDFWSNAGIRSLKLPHALCGIGSYAFMGLRRLEKVSLFDRSIDWGITPFMNCILLHHISLLREGEDAGNLALLCRDINTELHVRIQMIVDGRAGSTVAGLETVPEEYQLLFPAYSEIIEENTPARQFNQTVDGVGYPYHHVFRNRKLSLTDYDSIWKNVLGRGGEIQEILMRIAWFRLRYPHGLAQRFRTDYYSYLESVSNDIFCYILEDGTPSDMEHLLGMLSVDPKVKQKGCEEARRSENTAMMAVLLEGVRGEHQAGRQKRYEL